MNKPLTITAVVLAVIAGVYIAVPAVRGPFNRARNAATEALNDEFVVDNYRAEAMKLKDQRVGVVANIKKFTVEKRVAEAKLANAQEKSSIAKQNLIATGTADLTKFNRAKDAYETCRTEVSNLSTLVTAYENAIKKLEDTRTVIDGNIQKLKVNIATLQSKKTMADSLKAVNKTIENISGIGEDSSLGYTVEKLDDTILEESIKIAALDERSAVGDAEDAKRYLEAIQNIAE